MEEQIELTSIKADSFPPKKNADVPKLATALMKWHRKKAEEEENDIKAKTSKEKKETDKEKKYEEIQEKPPQSQETEQKQDKPQEKPQESPEQKEQN